MNVLLTFASGLYLPQRDRLVRSAQPWFDKVLALAPKDIGADENIRFAKHRRGYGFWAWKPHLILRELLKLSSGDVLMYCDSACIFIDDPTPLFELCLKLDGILLFHQKREGHCNRTWTTGICFSTMGCAHPAYYDGPQVNAAISVWAPTNKALHLVREWEQWCRNELAVGDDVGMGGNLPGFKDHRHDQSVLSLLVIRDSIVSMPDPTQFGNGYMQKGRTYGQIIDHNRTVAQCQILSPLPV
jgi:hypothetical protein